MHILAIQVEPTTATAAVFDTDTLQPVGDVGRVELTPNRPTRDAHEVDAESLWQAVAKASRMATHYTADVQGVGMAVMSPALVLVDRDDKPLGSIWTSLDRRSRSSARQVWAGVGDEFLQTTGCKPAPGTVSAIGFRHRLINDPYLTHRVARYLHLNGWLALRMTGETASDPSNAGATGLFNTATDQHWSPRWCEFFEVDLDWLPPVVCGATTVGSLRSQTATELGVPAGIPVKLGTDDLSITIFAANLKPGDLLHIAGESQILAVRVDAPKPSEECITRRYGIGDGFVQIACNPVGSLALDWIRRLCFREQGEDEFFETTIPEAMSHTTRVQLDPPFLSAAPLEIAACWASFREMNLATDRIDLLAALLNAMKRCHGRAVEALGQGDGFRSVALTGSRTDAVRRIISDYTDSNIINIENVLLAGVARLFTT